MIFPLVRFKPSRVGLEATTGKRQLLEKLKLRRLYADGSKRVSWLGTRKPLLLKPRKTFRSALELLLAAGRRS